VSAREDGASLSDRQRTLLHQLLDGTPLTEWCRRQERREDPAAVASALNEYAADVLGDVILEECGGEWQLIDDYREEIRSWITP
jgi:hypothetical protein